jgi:hydrogenase/urease accessory protein HupE
MKRHQATTALLSSSISAVWILLIPDVALAHLVTTGMGPVYDGIGHLLLTPEDLVPVIAVALYAGLRGKTPGRRALFCFPLAWMIGGFAGLLASSTPVFPIPMLSFLLLGALVAADLHLSDNIITALIIAVGIMHGFFNGIAMEGGPGVSGLLGITSTLFVLVAITTAFVTSLQATWARVVVRVIGSWVTAVGLLMFGWLVRANG